MGADTPQIVCPICLPKPKSLGFSKKSSLWVSVVRVLWYVSFMLQRTINVQSKSCSNDLKNAFG